jgi:hypothetical protein
LASWKVKFWTIQSNHGKYQTADNICHSTIDCYRSAYDTVVTTIQHTRAGVSLPEEPDTQERDVAPPHPC